MRAVSIFFIFALLSVVEPLGDARGTCPHSWTFISFGNLISCINLKSTMVYSMIDASNYCDNEYNASLVVIDSEEKLTHLDNLASEYHYEDNKFWLGLQKYPEEGITWLTREGNVSAVSLPERLQYNHWPKPYIVENYGILYSPKTGIVRDSYDYNGYYPMENLLICEIRPECDEGFYGMSCENVCHCHGKPCDQEDGLCPFGCQVGWMGPGCNKEKKEADVEYLCEISPEQGKLLNIRIKTKGVHYDNIRAVDDQGELMDWCNSTEVSIDEASSTTSIKMFLDKDTVDGMKNGTCPGTRSSDVYSWTLKLQEKNGFQSREDKQVLVSCKDSEYTALELSTKIAIEFAQLDDQEAKMITEQVFLDVVDAFDGSPIAKTLIGSPVVLKIRFGVYQNSQATGVVPYNCEASSSDGSHRIRLLDAHGCRLESSIISPFMRNGTKSIMTKPFPLLRFPNSRDIFFHCSYTPCFGGEPCPVGCGDITSVRSRRRRDTGTVERRLVSSIRVDKI